jgi:cobalt-precorrin 5A hydrolase
VGLGEAVIVAGVGFRRQASAAAIVAVVRRALVEAGVAEEMPALLCTAAPKAHARAFAEAAAALSARPLGVADNELGAVEPLLRTRSERVRRLTGVGSVAEAAALVGAGPGARLILPRIADPGATCALAESAR